MVSSSMMARTAFGGYEWELSRAADPDRLKPILERFSELETLPSAEVLKKNQLRQVVFLPDRSDACAIEGPGATPSARGVIAKTYRYLKTSERLRNRLWRSRAEQEWFALQRVEKLGIPTATPLAVAKYRENGSIRGGGLLAEFLHGTRPLVEVIYGQPRDRPDLRALFSQEPLTDQQAEWISRAAEAVRRMHDCGAWHRDLHGGNLLCRIDDGKVYFIDLHSCRFLPRLAVWQRREGVGVLLHSLAGTMGDEGVRRFLETYGAEALGGTVDVVERRTLASISRLRRKRVRSRSERCFKRSTLFDIDRRRGQRVYRRRVWPAQDLTALFQQPPPSTVQVLKETRDGWVATADCGERRVCVKYRRCSLLEGLQSLVESHRLRRAYAAGHALWVRRIPTPEVIALCERRRFGVVRESYLVTEFVNDAMPMDCFLKERYSGGRLSPAESRAKHHLTVQVGKFVRSLHDAALYPHDLSPQNILIQDAQPAEKSAGVRLQIVDLDHIYLWQPLWQRGRLKNLVQAGNLPEGHITTADLFRGLRAYAESDAQYWSAEWIAALRSGILSEHLKQLTRQE